MSDVSQWSNSAASNNSAPPDGAPEGMAPSTVNDVIREVMAAVSRWHDDLAGGLVTGGAGNAYTLTSNTTHAALADQNIIVFRADRANTGSATLNVDALGAKTIKADGGNLSSGDLVQNQLYAVAYNATNDTYDLLNAKAGLTIGTDVQAWDAVLDDLSALTAVSGADQFIVSTGAGTYAHESASTARGSLGLGSLATLSSVNNSNWSGTDLAVANGGTGASDAGTARTNLGLGSISTQNSSSVTITGGSITGITDLAVADGGTGASTATAAATNLGLGTGNNVQFNQVNVGGSTNLTQVSAGQMAVAGDAVFSHDASTATYASAKVFFNDAAPTTQGNNGDIWFEY